LRRVGGRVDITYGVNDDPARWGFDLLGMDMDSGVARGFPVIEARVRYPAEGYAGLLGWVQVVSYVVKEDSGQETVWVVPDLAPQTLDANTPYTVFGIEPVLFDALASDEQDEDLLVRSFLAYTPDCLVTSVVEPVCGFVWGYDIERGNVRLKDIRPSVADDWLEIRRMLRIRLPKWTFGGNEWNPPAFDN